MILSPTTSLPTIIALVLLLIGGFLLLEKAERQARDTTRKHHIEDIEKSLYFARGLHGTFPPYSESTWCGVLNAPENRAVQAQVEAALRAQHEKYENPDKPFPEDPLLNNDLAPRSRPGRDFAGYFYWKRSPASFELYSVLEEDPNGERNTATCGNGETVAYDYGVASVWRESSSASRVLFSPL